MNFFFNVKNNSTEEEMDSFLYCMFQKREMVVLNINLMGYTDSFLKLIKFKKLLDKYRNYSREYIDHTNVIINNKLVVLILQTIIMIFQPERPVLIKFKEYFN